MRAVSDKVIGEMKSQFYVQIFFPENCAVYEIRWKNIVLPDRLQMTIWNMHVERRIPKDANIHSKYVILNVFPLLQ